MAYFLRKGRKMKYTKLCYEGFEKYFKFERPVFDGYQWKFEFENGFGTSVVKHGGSYGSHEDLFELAVLKDGHLCYSTSITNDVIGHLKNDEVLELLEKIKTLRIENAILSGDKS